MIGDPIHKKLKNFNCDITNKVRSIVHFDHSVQY